MKFISRKITPEIKLYYLGEEPDWGLVKKVSRIFDGSVEPFKTKHRHQVYLLEHNSEVYYVKKFSPPTIEQSLSYRFRQSKAVSCIHIANRLQVSGFKTIEPVFALNFQKNVKHVSLLVTKKIKGINLLEFFNNNIDNHKKEVMNCLVSTLGLFYKNGFLHYDPILTNFMIDPEKEPEEIIFLDFESITHRRWVSNKRTFDVFSKFNYIFYSFLISQNNERLYSLENVLSSFLKS